MSKRLHLPTSTPLDSPNKKKKSIAFQENALVDATPIRTTTLSSYQEDEDEESQRHRRRSMANMQERLNNTEHYSKDIINAHLEICMKLYAKNKIDSKNVWAVKIIDYMSAMVRDNIFEADTLKVATNTMEVGSKVFGLRVDCVHAQTLQLASNMARNTDIQNEENEIANDDDSPMDPENPVEKPARKKRAKKLKLLAGDEPSIVKDVSTLFAPIKELPKDEFQIGQANINNAFSKYLTTSVEMNFDGRFMFMSDEKYFKTEEDLQKYDSAALDKPIDLYFNAADNDEENLDDIDLEKLKICPMFDDFWDKDTDKSAVTRDEHCRDEILFDNEGDLIAELDGSIHDPFIDGAIPDDDDDVEQENLAQIGGPNIANIVSVIPEESVYPYLYDTSNALNVFIDLWAGPSHWKVKWIKQRAATFTGSVQQNKEVKKRPKKQEAVELDFNENEEITTSVIRQKVARTKKTKHKEYRIPLQYITSSMKPKESFRNRYIIPIDARQKQPITTNEIDGLPEDYNYENPNDSQFCIDADDDAPDAYNDEDNPIGPENNDHPHVDQMETSDLDLPEICPKTNIGYAKHAKKMNMKKLKCAVWDYLAGTKTYYQDCEATTPKVHKMVGEKHFQLLYSSLPKKINKSMQEALSAPLAFSALLHLANDNNLDLKGVEEMNDIVIKQKE